MTRFARALHAGVLALAVLAASPAAAWESGSDGLKPVPPLAARVTDLTQTLTPADKQSLEAKLAAFEQQTGGQLVVLIVPSTQPEPIESYAIRVAEAWKIGRKGQDNGVLFVVARDDRKMRLEVGYGYEGVLPDITARRIIAEDVAPKFREGKFADGINAGVERVIGIVSKGETLAQKPAKKTSGWRDFDPGMFFILLFVVIPVVGAVLKRIFGKLLGSAVGAGVVGTAAWFVAGSLIIAGIAGVVALLVMLFAGGAAGLARGGGGWIPPTGGSGGGFGGGFGGGGGGGFSGGGGSFGGGGASGDW